MTVTVATGPALPATFYDRPVLDVARDLLGAVVTTSAHPGAVALRLVEVEAYGGGDDPASHAWRGRTKRNAAMFGPPGRTYVYRSYGLHWCCNVVTGPEGTPSAVLLRAAAVVAGLAVVQARRGGAPDRDLARGPGRLCAAMGIDGAGDGTPVTGTGPVTLHAGRAVTDVDACSGPRVGVSRAAERPWRWSVADDPAVSPFRPGRTAPRVSTSRRVAVEE